MKKYLFNVVLCAFSFCSLAQEPVMVKGPDSKLEVEVEVKEGTPFYTVSYEGEVFLEPSPLGLNTSIGNFSESMTYISHETRAIKESYELKKSKVSQVNYEANELITLYLNANGDTLKIVFRVSNSDVAFSYQVTVAGDETNLLVYGEATGFDLPDYATTFITPQAPPMSGWMKTKPSYEEPYTYDEPVGTPSSNGVGYTFPALFKIGEKGWALISETGVDSRYVGARLGEGTKAGFYPLEFPQEGENNSLGGTYAAMALPAQTPWRTITVGETLKPIVESTVAFDVVKPLYEPSQEYEMGKATWSWIVWQDPSMNYDDQVKFIDLAAALEFEFILIDALWDKNIGRERMEELVKYAASKKVGVLLWYNSNGYWNNAPQTPKNGMDTAPARKREMAWMQRIGVKGIKVDFFGGDKQATMKLYEDILSDANEYGIVVTFHGCTLPRGWERMYPNFVTSEAVLASENLVFSQGNSDAYAYTATILPFTRNSVAAMDFGPVFFNKKLSRDQIRGSVRRTTDAFEVATSVLYLSPVQHFGITPNNLEEQPENVLDFIRKVPTTWDETVLVEGYPGKHVVMARRKGEQWYVVAVNGEKKTKELLVDLPMLANREVNLIFDKEDRTAGFKKLKVDKKGKVKLTILPDGGAVIY
ncbi:glycoside hydrolase family 97 catalytic domain-containing protein [Echinicola jeungdonensis]|uniref:Glycoside hydrolase family 97 catalytic domain-containing protein n=1 Tax=Echinicola jeungdonensis TaxID=709343 RepID=A0ABV5JB12_9BACT|nr:glycoside hydrolase family 97 protein [Echinicola jeungdonensis]MDN3670445.1 glycoside hydrolase family 97 catalytic domain-containing protein [Echinicola jeungdonensis]